MPRRSHAVATAAAASISLLATSAAAECRVHAPAGHAHCFQLGSGAQTAASKEDCGHLCLAETACSWIYSSTGDFGTDCRLCGRLDDSVDLDDVVGKMYSRECFHWGPQSAPPPSPLSMSSLIGGFCASLVIFGLPALIYARRSCREANKIAVAQAPEPEDPELVRARQAARARARMRMAARTVIHAQRAADDLQRGMLRYARRSARSG